MKLERIKTKDGWKIRLTQGATITQAEGKTLKGAMRLAFELLRLSK